MASVYNTSSAYDFSAYEVQEKKGLTKESVRVLRARRQIVSSLLTPKAFCFFVMAVTVVCLMVYNNVCLNEVTGEINALTKEINEMHSENVRLQSELKSLVSPRLVAQTAENELGLKRLDKYQTEYIYLNREDKIELTEASPEMGIMEQAKTTVNSFATSVKEYIASW